MSFNPLALFLQPGGLLLGPVFSKMQQDANALAASMGQPLPFPLAGLTAPNFSPFPSAVPEKTPLQVLQDLAPLIIAGGAAVGCVGIVAHAWSNKKVVTEHWENQSAPGGLDRFRSQFFGARTGLKAWFKRHRSAGGLVLGAGLLGGLALLGTTTQPATAREGTWSSPYLGQYATVKRTPAEAAAYVAQLNATTPGGYSIKDYRVEQKETRMEREYIRGLG